MGLETIDTITGIIEPLLEDLGFELVEVQLRKESAGLVLRVIIHKEGGINVADCTLVSREAGYLLEVDDPIGCAYTLEVSSPGLDRPLVTPRDFERNKGKRIQVLFDDAGEQKKVIGTVQAVENEGSLSVRIQTGKEDLKIKLANIVKALLIIEF